MMLKGVVLLATVILVCGAGSPSREGFLAGGDKRSISPAVIEDALLDVVGLATKYGYPVEKHEVQTEDGYLLTVHRLPSGRGGQQVGNKPVVFLMHGLLSSSADWINMGPDSGLGYYLADEGFDVWMGNARGNHYSRKHISLNPDKDSKFWKFSWNEIGYYDLPAMIDYVLARTGESQMHYTGHSQGTTSFFVMASLRTGYNRKIKSMHALAPIAYMSYMKSPLVRLLAPLGNTVEFLTSLIGVNEFLPSTKLMTLAGDLLCKDSSVFQPVCSNILFLLCGFNPELLNSTMLPVMMAHTPAGSSSKQFVHYGQSYLSAKFRKYDHGLVGNLAEYGSVSPPEYNLEAVTAPVALHYSLNDWMADPSDVDQLYRELGNPIDKFLVPHPKFNHLDYLWAIDVRPLLYTRVLELMRSYN